MTTQDNNPKVVDFAQRIPGSGDKPVDVLGQVRGHAMKRMTGLVTTLFENADDALFDLASKANNNATQASFFDGMREVRKRRLGIEGKFQDRFIRHFSDFQAGRTTAVVKTEGGAAAVPGELTLALVDEQELEESLAVASMVAKAENRLQRPLFALNQRMAHLSNLRVEDNNNPIGPAVCGQMFRESMGDAEATLEVKLVMFKLFDRFVLGGLDVLYDELNALMIHAGVLPQLKGVVSKRPPGAASGGPAMPGQKSPMEELLGSAQGGAGGPGYDPIAAELQSNLYGSLRALMAHRREVAAEAGLDGEFASGGAGYSGPVLASNDLLTALAVLQTQALSAQSLAAVASAGDAAKITRHVKGELLSEAGKAGGDAKAHVSGNDEDTIDLVGMLFEYILQDRNLPAQMQALLGRLQIPFIKVALLDKHLFARRTHPARQLLDSLAEASVGWSEESDRDRRLYDKIKSIVEGLLKDFEDDVGIFDRLRTDFEAFVDSNKRRAELAEQRAAEATKGRDKLLGARKQAAREIVQRMEGRDLPELIKNLLSKPWANYLVLVLLRQGDQSDEWAQALRFADALIWSVAPKTDDASRTRLRSLLPELEKRLRAGLATVAFDENDVRRLIQQLHSLYTELLGESASMLELTPAPVAAPLAAGAAAPSEPAHDPMHAAESVLTALEEDAAPSEGVDPRHLQQVKELKVGTWIEFTDAQGNTERAKLSWISPISQKYLFVNRKGLKVADKNLAQLAAEIAAGRAAVLEEVPLFDRALDAIVERLKSAHAAKAGSSAAAPASPSQQPG